MNQFPQPTRPFNSYNLMPMPQPSVPFNMGNNLFSPRDRFQHHIFEPSTPQSTTKATEEEEQKAIEDLLRTVSEWYEKLPDSLKHAQNLDEMSAPTCGVNGGTQRIAHNFGRFKVNTANLNSCRGLDGMEEELQRGLERFKIRTVDLGGVVKEEKKR